LFNPKSSFFLPRAELFYKLFSLFFFSTQLVEKESRNFFEFSSWDLQLMQLRENIGQVVDELCAL